MPEQQITQTTMEHYEVEKSPVGWPWRIFSIALIIFSVAVLAYLGLAFGYQPFLKSKIAEQDAEIEQLSKKVSKDDQEQFIRFYSQLKNLKGILDNHILTSKIFPLLRKITHEKVYYTGASLKLPEQELRLDLVAESYAILTEQLEAYNQAEEIDSYTVEGAQVMEKAVTSGVLLKLKGNILK